MYSAVQDQKAAGNVTALSIDNRGSGNVSGGGVKPPNCGATSGGDIPPWDPVRYSWSHGFKVKIGHSSATCTNKREGHKYNVKNRADAFGTKNGKQNDMTSQRRWKTIAT